MKQYFMHFMLILFYASFYFMLISCSYQQLNVAAATFTGAAATIAAASIAAASVAAVSVAKETEKLYGEKIHDYQNYCSSSTHFSIM
jgi:multidrug transporter EmrE-like cation transporter